jgi:hypothetical protein
MSIDSGPVAVESAPPAPKKSAAAAGGRQSSAGKLVGELEARVSAMEATIAEQAQQIKHVKETTGAVEQQKLEDEQRTIMAEVETLGGRLRGELVDQIRGSREQIRAEIMAEILVKTSESQEQIRAGIMAEILVKTSKSQEQIMAEILVKTSESQEQIRAEIMALVKTSKSQEQIRAEIMAEMETRIVSVSKSWEKMRGELVTEIMDSTRLEIEDQLRRLEAGKPAPPSPEDRERSMDAKVSASEKKIALAIRSDLQTEIDSHQASVRDQITRLIEHYEEIRRKSEFSGDREKLFEHKMEIIMQKCSMEKEAYMDMLDTAIKKRVRDYSKALSTDVSDFVSIFESNRRILDEIKKNALAKDALAKEIKESLESEIFGYDSRIKLLNSDNKLKKMILQLQHIIDGLLLHESVCGLVGELKSMIDDNL